MVESPRTMQLVIIIVVISLVLIPPVGVLTAIAAHQVARWWALTSDKRTIKRINSLKRELGRLETIRLHQMLVPMGAFVLLIINAITLIISTTYVSLIIHLRLQGVEGTLKPHISLMALRVLRLTPILIGAAISIYAAWFVRRYWLRLPAYRESLEREIGMLESSLSPNILLE
jgi:hypothetical protein